MNTKSIYIPAPLHQKLKVLAAQEGKSLSEVVRRLLDEGLQRERLTNLAEQEQSLMEAYQAAAREQAQLAEESAQYAAEILDPDEEWKEYQE